MTVMRWSLSCAFFIVAMDTFRTFVGDLGDLEVLQEARKIFNAKSAHLKYYFVENHTVSPEF